MSRGFIFVVNIVPSATGDACESKRKKWRVVQGRGAGVSHLGKELFELGHAGVDLQPFTDRRGRLLELAQQELGVGLAVVP